MHEIIEVSSRKDLAGFIEFPLALYRGDPFYAPMPVFEQKKIFSPKNPFYHDADVKLFLLKENGKIKGRIASIVNRRHLAAHADGAGFFGFYESVDGPDIARALLDRVAVELGKAGLKLMRGPMNFSTNEECGFLVEGFDTPPMLMMPHNPPYYAELMEACGMRKSKDLFAFIHQIQERLPEKVLRVAQIAERKGITVRPINMKRLRAELQAFKDIYNSAWKDNWGFIPITDEELDDMAKRLKDILVPELALIAEKDGAPVGFFGLIPDFNQVLRRMKGRMGPVEIVKALYYSRKVDGLRMMLFGIKEDWRLKGVDALLIREAFAYLDRVKKYKQAEFSWILEDNLPVIRLTELMGSRLYKKMRIYEKEI